MVMFVVHSPWLTRYSVNHYTLAPASVWYSACSAPQLQTRGSQRPPPVGILGRDRRGWPGRAHGLRRRHLAIRAPGPARVSLERPSPLHLHFLRHSELPSAVHRGFEEGGTPDALEVPNSYPRLLARTLQPLQLSVLRSMSSPVAVALSLLNHLPFREIFSGIRSLADGKLPSVTFSVDPASLGA